MTNGGEQNRMDRVRDGAGYTTLNNFFSLWKNVNFYLIRESNFIFKNPEKIRREETPEPSLDCARAQ